MIRFRILVAAVLLGLAAGSADAQVPLRKPINVYIGGGGSLPSGDLGDAWNIGWHVSGQVGFVVPTATPTFRFEIIGEAAYHSFGPDRMGLDFDGGTFSSLQVGGGLKFSFPLPASGIAPAIQGSLGAASIDISEVSGGGLVISFQSETELYYSLAASLEFRRGFFRIGYTGISVDNVSISYVPFTIGFRF